MTAVVIIVTWEGEKVLPACLQALSPQIKDSVRLLVVDNGSTDRSLEYVRRYAPQAQIIENGVNLGFGGGMNVAFRSLLADSAPDHVLLLNQDTVVASGWLEAILQPFRDLDVAAVGCKLLYPDGKTIQHAGSSIEYPRAVTHHIGWHERDIGQYDLQCDIDYVTGAALALRFGALRQIEFFDEGYNPGYYEDSDLCWRLRHAGYRVVYTGGASSIHQESSSIPDPVWRSKLYNRGRLRFVLKTYSTTAFRRDFVPAERMFIVRHGIGAEARALRWAYLHTLISLRDILTARQAVHPGDAFDEVEVGRLLVSLRQLISDCARSRLTQTA